MDSVIEGAFHRRSGRLAAGRKRRRLEKDTALAQSSSSSSLSLSCYRPKATGSALQQDCGILPSECYRITASITDGVPWGFVCGYPIKSGSGDLYGGGHYIDSSASRMTPQGRAMKQATIDFGDGRTLPFAPCKRGYAPWVELKPKSHRSSNSNSKISSNSSSSGTHRTGDSNDNSNINSNGNGKGNDTDGEPDQIPKEYKRMVACSFHEKLRRKRLARDKGKLRGGEANPDELFWSKSKFKLEKETVTTVATTTTKTESESEKGVADGVVNSVEVSDNAAGKAAAKMHHA